MSDIELAGLPVGGPATLATAAAQLGMTEATLTPAEQARLEPILSAVNDEVRRWPVAARAVDLDVWPDGIVLGASMLCARLFMRKNSPAGVEVFGTEGAVYVARTDPDIAMLLKLGRWSGAQVG